MFGQHDVGSTDPIQHRSKSTGALRGSAVALACSFIAMSLSAAPAGAATVPTVTSVSPSAGPTTGGTVVTITGTGFVVGATTANFGTTPATSCSALATTSITCTAPAHSAMVLHVIVTDSNGTSATSTGDLYTYEAVPTVTSVLAPAPPAATSNTGPLAGGNTVTINGTGFITGAGGTTAEFGASAGGSCVALSTTVATCTAPAGSAGTVDVVVTTPYGTSAISQPTDEYTYLSAPTVTSVSPGSGPVDGGNTVTINGTGFVVGTGYTVGQVGGSYATGCVATTTIVMTCTVTADMVGLNETAVYTAGGWGVQVNDYAFLPTVTSVSPSSGPVGGGNTVTITGTGFVTGANNMLAAFGAYSALPCTATSTTVMTCTAASGPAAGTVDVIVAETGGTSAVSESADEYTYVAPTATPPTVAPPAPALPTVSAVTPNHGVTKGDTVVTITGTGFVPGATVAFGSAAGTKVVVVSSTEITVKSPAHSAGTVNVTVTTSTGTSTTSSADRFTFFKRW